MKRVWQKFLKLLLPPPPPPPRDPLFFQIIKKNSGEPVVLTEDSPRPF